MLARSRGTRFLLLLSLLAACSDGDSAGSSDIVIEFVRPPETAVPSLTYPDPIIVRVTDGDGNPLTGIPLTWDAPDGGTVASDAAESGLDGLATARWTLGPGAGTQRLQVSALGGVSTELKLLAAAWKAQYVDAGYAGACGITDGQVWCFGSYAAGNASVRFFPNLVVTGLSVADGSVCVLDQAGLVWCAGTGFQGLEGAPLDGLPPLSQISSDDQRYCGLALADSTAWCWLDTRVRVQVSTRKYQQVALGGSRGACFLDLDGIAWCGEFFNAVPVGGPVRFRRVAAGFQMNCGIAIPADLYCWGFLNIGNGQAAPEPVLMARGFLDVSLHVGLLAISPGGGGIYWNGATPQNFLDMPALTGVNVVQISADDSYCVRGADGTVYCDFLDGSNQFNVGRLNLVPIAPPIP